MVSRFKKLSKTIWHCQYHIVWCPKYRLKVLSGDISATVNSCIRSFSEQLKCEIVELNIQLDHVHLLVMIPPKVSVSKFMGTVKGRTAIRVFNRFKHLKKNYIGGIIFGRKVIVLTPLALTLKWFVNMWNIKKRKNEKLNKIKEVKLIFNFLFNEQEQFSLSL